MLLINISLTFTVANETAAIETHFAGAFVLATQQSACAARQRVARSTNTHRMNGYPVLLIWILNKSKMIIN